MEKGIYIFKKILLVVFVSFFCVSFSYSDDDIFSKLKTLEWIAYSPTHFNPKKDIYPNAEDIKLDLEVLRRKGFQGIVTYGSEHSLAQIPFIAKEVGFEGIIMGIWNIEDEKELSAAIAAVSYVDAYCLGNEGYRIRYDLATLKATINYIKSHTGKPVTTTEEIDDYYYDTDLVEVSDWIFPNAHPVFADIKTPKEAFWWLRNRVTTLRKRLRKKGYNKLIVIKESGFPTRGGRYYNQRNQDKFLKLLESSQLNFVYFEAFDQPWKNHLPFEPYWGLFKFNRAPKLYIKRKHEM